MRAVLELTLALCARHKIKLQLPLPAMGHQVRCDLMIGAVNGTLYFDEFDVAVSTEPAPPPPPHSPPPPANQLLHLDFEDYVAGQISMDQKPEGRLLVLPQEAGAAHSGHFGLFVEESNATSTS